MRASFTRSVSLSLLAAVLFLSGCSDGIETFTLEDIGGEAFPFHSPITALTVSDPDGALLVGTANGVIASFSTEDGLFTQLDREQDGKTIYDIAVNTAMHFYAVAVRDGGLHFKKSWGEKPDTVRIETKDTQYSPYKILLDSNCEHLYLGTSNGAHYYHLKERPDTAIAIRKADSTNSPWSFFSVTKTSESAVFAGEGGVFVPKKKEDGAFVTKEGKDGEMLLGKIQEETRDTTVFALHDGYFLLKDGSLWKNYESPEWVCDFAHSPLNFVIENNYVYAISVSLVEVLNLNDLEEAYAIRLPERHLNRTRNKSCRQNGLVKDNYLYVAPGGTSIYRIPLAPYDRGEEVISLCKGEGNGNGIYALSARNDLYSVRVDATCSKPEKSRYLFSFNKEDQVRLLGTGSDRKLVVSVNDTIYSFSGHNISKEPIYRTDLKGEKEKITCNFWTEGTLYQGRKDMARAYHAYSDSVRTFPKRENDGLESRPNVNDYYPSRMAMTHCNGKDILVVGTLHSGVAYRYLSDTAAPFERMIGAKEYSRILDIQAIDSIVYVLDDKRLSRFAFRDGICQFTPATVSLSSAGGMREYLNRVVPLSSDECYVFSDFYDFSSGVYYCRFPVSGSSGRVSSLFQGRTINDALLMNGGRVLFGGRQGILSNDVDGPLFSIRGPKLYERLLFSWWPWSLVLVTIGLAFLVGVGCLVYRWIKNRSIRKEKERKAQEIVKEVEGWHRILGELTVETYEAHLKDVEDEENRLGLSTRKVTDYKRDELFRKIVSLIEHQDVGDLEKCEQAIEKAGVARERIGDPKLRVEIDDIIDGFKKKRVELIKKQKDNLSKDKREHLQETYKSKYVKRLFDILVEESDLSELESNMDKFMEEETVTKGKEGNRLKTLDRIGRIIEDAQTIVNYLPACNNASMNSALFGDLQKIVDRYASKDDDETHLRIQGRFDSCVKNGVFVTFKEAENPSNRSPQNEQYEIVRAFYELYTMLREEMSGRFDKYLKRFFMSYSSEKELDEAQYKLVFKELDKLTDHKRWFLIFPYDKGNDNSFVDFLFPNKSYAVRKSDWKKPAKGSGEKHHLPSLADRKEYGGLFGLIAKAGLKHLDVGGDS